MVMAGREGGMGADRKKPEVQNFSLEKETELRCEVKWDTSVTVSLASGSAEIFGTEIAQGQKLKFRGGDKFAVFTWDGAVVDVEGNPEVVYKAEETPMLTYINVHAVLDQRRKAAKQAWTSHLERAAASAPEEADVAAAVANSQGPRVIVVGPTDSGKTTLCRILASYGARIGWKPTFVELDIGQGVIAIPGTIGAALVEAPIDPIDGFSLETPLIFYYGHQNPSQNADLLKAQVQELTGVLEKQFAGSPETRTAGMIINTMGWIEGLGYDLLLHTIDTLKADVVLVLGQERLYSMLKDVLKSHTKLDILKMPSSGGVVTRSTEHRARCRARRIKDYFEGVRGELSPYSSVVSFDDVAIYRVGGGPRAPQSALPIGVEPSAGPKRVIAVTVGQDLLHRVLGVSYATEPSQILSSNFSGFVHVTEINMEKRTLVLLAPCPGPLPSNILIAGSLHWVP